MPIQTQAPDPAENRSKLPQKWLDGFLSRIDRNGPNGCWLWTGYRSKRGYGTYATVKEGSQFAHRICYELCYGKVPAKMHLHHKCENPPCCNPAHLEVLTAKQHHEKSPKFLATQRSEWTHCIRGHAFDEKNTYISNAGKRMCRICLRDRMRESRARALAANPKPPKVEATHCIWGHLLSEDNVAVVKEVGQVRANMQDVSPSQ